MGPTEEPLKEILDAFNRHDLNAIMSSFAEEGSLDLPSGPDPRGQRGVGKADVRAALARRLEGVPDVQYGEDRPWVAGDRGVSEWLLTGTSRDGVTVRARGCDLREFREREVVRKDPYWKRVEK